MICYASRSRRILRHEQEALLKRNVSNAGFINYFVESIFFTVHTEVIALPPTFAGKGDEVLFYCTLKVVQQVG